MDLHMLRTKRHDDVFFAAGVPWYVALFGRDSLVTALQVVALQPEIAADTLRVLARWQGTQIDDWREQKTRSEESRVGKEGRYWRDWSSDVCSSDLWTCTCCGPSGTTTSSSPLACRGTWHSLGATASSQRCRSSRSNQRSRRTRCVCWRDGKGHRLTTGGTSN